MGVRFPSQESMGYNSNVLDILYFTLLVASPESLVKASVVGSILQSFVCGVVTVLFSRYVKRFWKHDTSVEKYRVAALVVLTSTTFFINQIQTFKVVAHVDIKTGHGIANIFASDWDMSWAVAYLLCFAQVLSLWYFCSRAWCLWSHNRLLITISIVAMVVVLGLGIGSLSFVYGTLPRYDKDLTWERLIPLLPSIDRYGNLVFRVVSAWMLITMIFELVTTIGILVGIHRHKRAAQGFQSLQQALGKGMIYLMEAMFLPLVLQIMFTVFFLKHLGMGTWLRAFFPLQCPLYTFSVLHSMLSRQKLRDLLGHDNTVLQTGIHQVMSSGPGRRRRSTTWDSHVDYLHSEIGGSRRDTWPHLDHHDRQCSARPLKQELSRDDLLSRPDQGVVFPSSNRHGPDDHGSVTFGVSHDSGHGDPTSFQDPNYGRFTRVNTASFSNHHHEDDHHPAHSLPGLPNNNNHKHDSIIVLLDDFSPTTRYTAFDPISPMSGTHTSGAPSLGGGECDERLIRRSIHSGTHPHSRTRQELTRVVESPLMAPRGRKSREGNS